MFSIIVPVFNVKDYVAKCVNSILDQSFRDFELILVDDGSNDQSGGICDEFCYDNRVKIIHQQNRGLSTARNRGICEATEEYVIFVDGDDYIEPDSLKEIHKGLDQANYPDVLVTRIRRFFENGQAKYMDFHMPIELLKKGVKEDYVKWIFGKSDNTWPSVRYVVRRETIRKNELAFRMGYLHEDIDWTSRLFIFANTFGCIAPYWYNHRKGREGSITSSTDPQGLLNMIEIVAFNMKNPEYETFEWKEIVFSRMLRSVFSKLKEFRLFNNEEKKAILESLNNNKDIFSYERRNKNRLFILFCSIFGFRAGLSLLGFLRPELDSTKL